MDLSSLAAYGAEKHRLQECRKWPDFPSCSVLADPDTGEWAALLMREWDGEAGAWLQRCDLKCGREALRDAPYLTRPFRMKGERWVGVEMEAADPDVVCRLLDRAVSAQRQRGYTVVLASQLPQKQQPPPDPAPRPDVPERLQQMLRLYQFGDTFQEKCANFYRQGKFMEDYTDDAPWSGAFQRYFPTYHDLNLRQLRGYFTWRAGVRRGEYAPAPASMAYIYLYELLNGIGASGPDDALRKMQAFEVGFLDSGMGDADIRKNLRRWMLEYAVVHNLPPELALACADPIVAQKDKALSALRDPQAASDREVFSALCYFEGGRLEQSPVLQKDEKRGKHLFATAWRAASGAVSPDGRDFFTCCFGERKAFQWYPLGNAVYWQPEPPADADYLLDPCRAYRCHGGVWWEERYDNLFYDRARLHGLLHEADRAFRRYLKTGRYLRAAAGEEWASGYAEQAIAEDRQAALEAARPKISIDFGRLGKIRADAAHTRDSLLAETEPPDVEPPAPAQPPPPEPAAIPGLQAGDPAVLRMLLRGEPVESYLKENRLMPSIVADRVNEAFYDAVGDNVLQSDGGSLILVEDYREEVLQLLGGEMT